MQLSNHQLDILEAFIADDIDNAVRSRGKLVIKKIKDVRLLRNNKIHAKVEGSSSETYDVKIIIDEAAELVEAYCTCYYFEENYDNCKHIAAVAFHCTENNNNIIDKEAVKKELLRSKLVQLASSLPQKEAGVLPLIGMEYELKAIPQFWNIRSIPSLGQKALGIFSNKRQYSLVESKGGRRFDLIDAKGKLRQFIEKGDKKDRVVVGCNCPHFRAVEPCYHILALFLILDDKIDKYHFKQFEDFTIEKNKLLQPYGFTVADEMANDFKFGFDYGGVLIMTDIPQGMLPIFNPNNTDWMAVTKALPVKKIKNQQPIVQPTTTKSTDTAKPPEPFDAAILFNLNANALQGFRIEGFKITQKGTKLTYTSQRLRTKNDLAIFNNAPIGLQNALFNIIEDNLVSLIKDNTNAYNISDNQPFRNLRDDQIELINTEYSSSLQEMATYLSQWKHLYYLPDTFSFSKSNVLPCQFVSEPLEHKIELKQNDKTISIELTLHSKQMGTVITNYTVHKFLILHNGIFYITPKGMNRVKKYLPHGKLMAPIAAKSEFIRQIVLPLSLKFDIDMGDVVKTETIAPLPEPRVYLSELNDKYLMITPKWLYGEHEMDNDNDDITTLELGDGLLNITRNSVEESKLVDFLRPLHPSFQHQNNGYFYLHFDDVMKKNWFLTMYQQLQELDIPIFGMNNLHRFKYNTNKPLMEFKTGSGTDWFDIKMTVSYGDQVVPLATLRKAIINKQQFVLLTDGTLGMLPDEWIKKFATLMRMGTVKDDAMQVSKLHWTVIDQLHEQITETDVFNEILAKKEKLKDIENVKKVKLPSNIKATLRDYQKSGFQWMNMLDEMGWGGCLADDMGLGKTLQTLTFLSGLQQKYKGETHLIVCPTSLIYNWETEINKFTPHLNYHIHYGNDRQLIEHDIVNADIIITSYGILRSDIEQLAQYKFGYIILDESQAIKNHLSQTAKAVQLIKSRNRLILSGTPVQNNTFDLYAQFNFINPGLLGNMEFFKTEFANPIDRDNDKTKSEELRRLVYPFMLRRTKEQVAKDLPAKTETILWCEMESKQRTIYNRFKEDYRKNIMQKIAEEGFAKAGIYILSGLTKLRQICDSPAILNEAEAYPNVSIKIDELLREIDENASNHKALVFSQFTSMLKLIAAELDKREIAYYYLDGSTKAAERKTAVENFQKNEEVKIFLISLKAGGVGLNLTAADYVYMVDPWWNPAAEQQAIDRTHRIGQQKSVFAYKLICKDSIEEKILQLQQKKKSLSADLISDENGFVKKLTKDDVAYLFS